LLSFRETQSESSTDPLDPTELEKIFSGQKIQISMLRQELTSFTNQKQILLSELEDVHCLFNSVKNEKTTLYQELLCTQQEVVHKDRKISEYFDLYNVNTENSQAQFSRLENEIYGQKDEIRHLENLLECEQSKSKKHIRTFEIKLENLIVEKENYSTDYESVKKEKDFLTSEFEKLKFEIGMLQIKLNLIKINTKQHSKFSN
jgi:chromosome segregation ATPase